MSFVSVVVLLEGERPCNARLQFRQADVVVDNCRQQVRVCVENRQLGVGDVEVRGQPKGELRFPDLELAFRLFDRNGQGLDLLHALLQLDDGGAHLELYLPLGLLELYLQTRVIDLRLGQRGSRRHVASGKEKTSPTLQMSPLRSKLLLKVGLVWALP